MAKTRYYLQIAHNTIPITTFAEAFDVCQQYGDTATRGVLTKDREGITNPLAAWTLGEDKVWRRVNV